MADSYKDLNSVGFLKKYFAYKYLWIGSPPWEYFEVKSPEAKYSKSKTNVLPKYTFSIVKGY